MNKANGSVVGIKIGLGIALLTTLAGCLGYAGGGYGGPVGRRTDRYVFGGSYESRRDVQAYSRRGSESRASARRDGGRPEGRR